ncbi:histidine phosphatase family protein [Loigolactobacillus coryniformis]|uniref:histidine phosphatase family protein n=1 Tax=Loigolactobacillus coryniformis TaxID=1610 RepID=UPI0023408891|nr:histidine phosphatase family protein [Loigolactobacillus coryniformis]MDC4186949.1 histidine phosphatase family protein [Loigolactobacillus coryniformis]
MTEFYFIRHGVTPLNQQHRFCGSGIDTPLAAVGIAGARRAGCFLQNIKFTHAYTSPLQRAQATLENVLAVNKAPQVPTTILADLREINLGDWDGDVLADHQQEQQCQYYFKQPELFDATIVHAESYTDLEQRGRRALLQIFQENLQGNVLIASHGVLLMTLLQRVLGVPLSEIRRHGVLDNTSVTQLSSNDGSYFIKAMWNETSFL